MANKIKLGNRPKTFKGFDVSVTLPDGEECAIPVVFKYRTKKEFGKWMDEAIATAKKTHEASESEKSAASNEGGEAPPEEFSWEKFYEKNTHAAVDQLLGAIDSWGLDIPLARGALEQLGDEIPAGVSALLSAYGAACREGKLGN